jgi:hypothetical protein
VIPGRHARTTRRENSTRRTPPRRQPNTRILVVCGGVRTEPAYLDGLKQWARNPAVHVRVISSGKSPAALVAHAARIASTVGDDYDELWCLFDVDEFVLDRGPGL